MSLTLEQQLELIRPYAEQEGAEAFIEHEIDEDGNYPPHVAIAFPAMRQVAEDEWEADVDVVSLSESDLCEGGEFFRTAFFALAAELEHIRAAQEAR